MPLVQQPKRGSRNLRNWWVVTSEPYRGAHFATFGQKWIEPCILAGTSAKGCCPACGAPWERIVEKAPNIHPGDSGRNDVQGPAQRGKRPDGKAIGTIMRERFQAGRAATTTGWRPTCEHGKEPVPCKVLDPFAGTATAIRVANRLGRKAIGLDISAKYLALANDRTSHVQMEIA